MNERETAALQIEDLTYNADGLIPCIVQDEQTREVLMMAWMNEEAVRRTISQGTTWIWSRSRQKFWHKGEESGNTQKLVLAVGEKQESASVACMASRLSV